MKLLGTLYFITYLGDFHKFCKHLGGSTAEVMVMIFEFEVDRSAFIITTNSFGPG